MIAIGLEVVSGHEERIGSANLASYTMFEGLYGISLSQEHGNRIVIYEECSVNVMRSPAQEHCVECDYENFETILFRSLEQRNGYFVCLRPWQREMAGTIILYQQNSPVELKPSQTVAISLRHLLNRPRGRRAEYERYTQAVRGTGCRKFSIGMPDALYANGRNK
jgi:hypothetical protein